MARARRRPRRAGGPSRRPRRLGGRARAYADWAGKDLPTEAEWEHASRGGLSGAEFAWGDELTPGGRHQATVWQGGFPHANTLDDGYYWTSPVGAFPANGYGLHDMIGNVRGGRPTGTPATAPPAVAPPPNAASTRHFPRPAARQPQAIDTATWASAAFNAYRRRIPLVGHGVHLRMADVTKMGSARKSRPRWARAACSAVHESCCSWVIAPESSAA